jgi:Ca2+-binding EF-hand superfamily protein
MCKVPFVRRTRRAGFRQKVPDTFFPPLKKFHPMRTELFSPARCGQHLPALVCGPLASWLLALGLFAGGTLGCKRQTAQPASPVVVSSFVPDQSPPEISPESTLAAKETAAKDRSAEDEHPPSPTGMPEADVEASQELERWRQGNWTTRRLVVMGDSGPLVIDLSLSIGLQSLQGASDAAVATVAETIFSDLEKPVTWDALLEHPLVRSGWLGNLIPEDEQRDTLIRMYDTQADSMVDAAELAAFLSRGLARNDPLQISDAGVEPNANMNQSPWGAADSNKDYALDTNELAELATAIRKFDYNGDNIVALQELSSMASKAAPETSMTRNAMLSTTTLMQIEESDSQDSQAADRARRKFATDLLKHYTFLAELPREQWPCWTDQAWAKLDADDSQSLSRVEIEQLATMAPDAEVFIRFPSLDEESTAANFQMRTELSVPMAAWHSSESGGQLATPTTAILVQLRDAFSTVARSQLRQQLAQALKAPQLKAFIQSRFQLQEDAFDLLDSNQDEKLSDEEFNTAWQWLSVRQGTRLSARWMVASTPWFGLADSDGDQRLSELEIANLAERIAKLDRNTDGLVTPNELPLIAKMEVSRADGRLASPAGMPQPRSEIPDGDWFSAMDTNRDGYLSYREFLGDRDDFERMDTNKDGFVSPSEVY